MFENKAFTLSLLSRESLERNFFTPEFFRTHRHIICNLKASDFLTENGTTLAYLTFCERTDLLISNFVFLRLKDILAATKTKLSKTNQLDKNTIEMELFVCRSRSGNSRLSKIMTHDPSYNVPHNKIKFSETIDALIGLEQSRAINKL